MNAYFLLKPDGTESDVSQCGKCLTVANGRNNFDISKKCCSCYICGLPLLPDELKARSLYHRTCEDARRQRIEIERMEKAELVTDYNGPVYLDSGCPSGGWGDGYFESLDSLIECLDEDEMKEIEFAYCCTEHPVAHMNAGSILESACEDADGDACDRLNGEDEFYKACEAFNKANEGVSTYYVDYKRKVAV